MDIRRLRTSPVYNHLTYICVLNIVINMNYAKKIIVLLTLTSTLLTWSVYLSFAETHDNDNQKIRSEIDDIIDKLINATIPDDILKALHEFEKVGKRAAPALPYILKVLKYNDNVNIQSHAIEVLGNIGDPGAIADLKDYLYDENLADSVRAALEKIDPEWLKKEEREKQEQERRATEEKLQREKNEMSLKAKHKIAESNKVIITIAAKLQSMLNELKNLLYEYENKTVIDGLQTIKFYASFNRIASNITTELEKCKLEFEKLEGYYKEAMAPETLFEQHRKTLLDYKHNFEMFVKVVSDINGMKRELTPSSLNDVAARKPEIVKSKSTCFNLFPAADTSSQAATQKTYHKFSNNLAELRSIIESWSGNGALRILKPGDKDLMKRYLPWRNVYMKVREPRGNGKQKPAYLKSVDEEDFKAVEVDLTDTVDSALAEDIQNELLKLNKNNPVLLYQWVSNNVSYQPYYGSAKGADKTYYDRAGNDFDIASLLIALLRKQNIPCRYVYGTVRLNIAQANNLFGTYSVKVAEAILARNGVPARWDGTYLTMEHCWIEAYLPAYIYSENRDEDGKMMWVALDPSFKDYVYTKGTDIAKSTSFNWADFFQKGVTEKTAAEIYSVQIAKNPGSLENVMIARTINNVVYTKNYTLPRSLPYEVESVHYEFSEVPDSFRHKVRYKIFDDETKPFDDKATFDITLPTVRVYSKRTTIESSLSENSRQTVSFFGNINQTPLYLATFTPTFLLDGKALVSGDEHKYGDTLWLRFQVILPDGVEVDGDKSALKMVNFPFVVGEYVAIGHNFNGNSKEYNDKQYDILKSNMKSLIYDEVFGQIAYSNITNWYYNVYKSDKLICDLNHIGLYQSHVSLGIARTLKDNGSIMGNVVSSATLTHATSGDLVWTMIPLHDEKVDDDMIRIMAVSDSQLEGLTFKKSYGMDPVSAISIIQYAYEKKLPVYNGWLDDYPKTNDIYIEEPVNYKSWRGLAWVSDKARDGRKDITGQQLGGRGAQTFGAGFVGSGGGGATARSRNSYDEIFLIMSFGDIPSPAFSK